MKFPIKLIFLVTFVFLGSFVVNAHFSREVGNIPAGVSNSPFPSTATPAGGNLDTAFSAGVGDGRSSVNVSVPLAGGKILVGGGFTNTNGIEKPYLVRLNSDGSLDDTFNPGGSGPNEWVRDIVILPDGKILIGGYFTSYNGIAKSGILRLNNDGTMDSTFNPGGSGTTGAVQSISLQADGKILISALFTAYNGIPIFSVARLNADGTLDTSFVSPFTSAQYVDDTLPLPNGQILIGGLFGFSGGSRYNLNRLNTDGSIDFSFNSAGTGLPFDESVFALRLQTDGKILIGGKIKLYNGNYQSGLARLLPDGTLDETFSTPASIRLVDFFDVLPDGKILAAGYYAEDASYALRRFNTDGSIDETFEAPRADMNGYHVTRQSDGKILLTGTFRSINGEPRRSLVRLEPSGAVDASFITTFNTYGQVSAIARQADGKVVAAGNFGSANGVRSVNIARFNEDGTLDAAFVSNSGTLADPDGGTNTIYSLAVQPDGKILMGGWFGGFDGVSRRGLVRLNPDGTIDPSFNFGFVDPFQYPQIIVNDIVVLPSGKILVGGSFTTFINPQTTERRVLLRLNSDGTPDSTFSSGLSFNAINRIVVQPDGRIIAVGSFSSYAGQPARRVMRLNANGTFDTTFSVGSGPNSSVTSVALQPLGQVLISGNFTSFNGVSRARIARLNFDGSLDASFDPGTGLDSPVLSFALQPDGKIVIGGVFSSYDGNPAKRLARIDDNGDFDLSFVSGFDNDTRFFVRRLLLQPDGKLLVGGTFRSYDGVVRNSIARVLTSEPATTPPASFDYDGDGRTDFSVFRPTEAGWYLQRSTEGFFGMQFGVSSDKITPADFDGDGKTDIAVYRPSDGRWYVANSSNGTYSTYLFGLADDLPAPADYDGDGRADVAVFRPFDGTWYVQRSSNGFLAYQFGAASDKPTVGDFDGDGLSDFAVYRTTNGEWYQHHSSDGSIHGEQFGFPTDKLAYADYDGDGKTDLAVFRPEDRIFYIRNSQTATYSAFFFGVGTDIPTPGDYDGDGRADLSVFRPSDGHWYRLNSGNGSFEAYHFGANGDRPTPTAFH